MKMFKGDEYEKRLVLDVFGSFRNAAFCPTVYGRYFRRQSEA